MLNYFFNSNTKQMIHSFLISYWNLPFMLIGNDFLLFQFILKKVKSNIVYLPTQILSSVQFSFFSKERTSERRNKELNQRVYFIWVPFCSAFYHYNYQKIKVVWIQNKTSLFRSLSFSNINQKVLANIQSKYKRKLFPILFLL